MSFEAALSIGTPVAVIVAAIIQGFDAAKIKRQLARDAKAKEAQLADIHGLVNSAMSVQLKVNARLARRIAVLTADPGDVTAAVEAETAARDHDAAQAEADKKKRASETQRYPT